MTNQNQWHLDKRVPVTMIIAILIQTVAVIWYMSELNSRVGSTELRVAELEFNEREITKSVLNNTVSAAVTTSSLINIQQSLDHIETEIRAIRSLQERAK